MLRLNRWWILAAVVNLAFARAASPGESPAITPQQIEADWLRQDELRNAPAVLAGQPTCREDATGGVDGVKNGKWGFHTQAENNPWWQVDLGATAPLDRVVVYNRCDAAQRNTRLIVSLSDDGKNFRQAYQHPGSVFYGFTDKKPLEVKLSGAAARYVRVGVTGHNYFHLDEVEVYAVGRPANIALGKPADQSSVSTWSVRHAPVAVGQRKYSTATVIQRGRKLADCLRRMKVPVDAETQTLDRVAGQLQKLGPTSPDQTQRELFLQAHWAVRRMALRNPLLGFDTILFVKRAPGIFPHMSDQHYGWWSRPGGGIFLLGGYKGEQPRIRSLTADMPEGNFLGPDFSYDGQKLLFAYCRYYPHVAKMANKVDKDSLPEDSFYHIYEMNADGSGRRRLTHGRYDDFDPRYLPNGEIAFLSTRKGVAIQCGKESASATAAATCPDSYVRCGGGAYRPVSVFTLHVMDAQGGNFRPISAFENFEWTPSVARDGRLLYARWDYIDRFNGPYISLWSTNPDGTNAQLVYGNYTVRPQCVFEPRAIPNSNRLVFTASAHHSITGGSLCLLDRTRGTEDERPLVRLTPEVAFPETEGWDNSYYANPYPLSEQFFLVAWSDRRLPPHTIATDERNPVNALGVYLYDAFGNLELLYRDAAISSQYPLPMMARERPPAIPGMVDWNGPQVGQFLVQDVYRGLEEVPRGTIKRLRIVAMPPKVQPEMNAPVLGVSAEDPGKFVLGTVPVEADGSAFVRVPSGVPVFFQALDAKGLTIQTMRTLAYVQPQQTQACIGCHEHRDQAPPLSRTPLAALRGPSKLTPGPAGSWPLRYDELVQPVLDKACVSCHRPGSQDAKAAVLDLTPANSYTSLISFGGEDLKRLAFERNRSIPWECTARKSKLYAILAQEKGHAGVRLDRESLDRLVLWMDLYAHRQGSFSASQEKQLRQLRRQWVELFAAGAAGGE